MIGAPRVGVPKRGKPWVGVPLGGVSAKGITLPVGFQPSLDFSDPRNSQFIPLMICRADWTIERLSQTVEDRFAWDRNAAKGVA